MRVVKCGTEVITKVGSIKATITAIEIKFDTVTYKLSYLKGEEFEAVWMNENEFTCDTAERTTIGFKKN